MAVPISSPSSGHHATAVLDPSTIAPEPDAIYEAFTDWAAGRGLEPYPAQAEALLELVTGSNVILATPTGSGKSLVATGLELATAVQGGRTFYTAPIKALVSEKFFAATEIFGPERSG
jgi:superfamily II RNA helicase